MRTHVKTLHTFRHYDTHWGPVKPYHVEAGDPVWWAVLKKYRSLGGQGLSPQALIHLTDMSWKQIRADLSKMLKTERSLLVTFCQTVESEVIKYMHQPGDWRPINDTNYNNVLDRLDAWVERFPSEKYVGVNLRSGETELTVYAGADDVVAKLRDYVKYVRSL